VARNTTKESGRRRRTPAGRATKESSGGSRPATSAQVQGKNRAVAVQSRRNGGWREIEALREKAALKASLADVWDENFDLDDEILAELDHTAEFFTTQEDPEPEEFVAADDEEEDEADEFFDDEEV
jgi:hypothetical protein